MIDRATLRPLLAGSWYDALLDVMADAATPGEEPTLVAALDLADCATRVLDLDADDFTAIAAAHRQARWADDLAACAFPPRLHDPQRGGLASLIPLFALMLEAVELRFARREPLLLVVTTHLMSEFLPQLAWEPVLGHAGDPLRLVHDVGERWGTNDRRCAHPAALRAVVKRALTAVEGDDVGFRAYLDRFHSRQGEALAVCAMNHRTTGPGDRPDCGTSCPHPCSWALRGDEATRKALDARCRLALIFRDGPLVGLRHHAPVGHFFGVPSLGEVRDAWAASWEKLAQPWRDGSNPLTGVAPDPTEALPGLTALVSAVAARPVRPAHLIRDIGDDLGKVLDAQAD